LLKYALRRPASARPSGAAPAFLWIEKSLGKGHNYLTLVYDLEAATVEYIEDDRRKESLDGYFSLLRGPFFSLLAPEAPQE